MIFICASILSSCEYYVFLSNQNTDRKMNEVQSHVLTKSFKILLLLINLTCNLFYVIMLFKPNHYQTLCT